MFSKEFPTEVYVNVQVSGKWKGHISSPIRTTWADNVALFKMRHLPKQLPLGAGRYQVILDTRFRVFCRLKLRSLEPKFIDWGGRKMMIINFDGYAQTPIYWNSAEERPYKIALGDAIRDGVIEEPGRYGISVRVPMSEHDKGYTVTFFEEGDNPQ